MLFSVAVEVSSGKKVILLDEEVGDDAATLLLDAAKMVV